MRESDAANATVLGRVKRWVLAMLGADVDGAVEVDKPLKRAKVEPFFAALPACVVGIEACAKREKGARLRGSGAFV